MSMMDSVISSTTRASADVDYSNAITGIHDIIVAKEFPKPPSSNEILQRGGEESINVASICAEHLGLYMLERFAREKGSNQEGNVCSILSTLLELKWALGHTIKDVKRALHDIKDMIPDSCKSPVPDIEAYIHKEESVGDDDDEKDDGGEDEDFSGHSDVFTPLTKKLNEFLINIFTDFKESQHFKDYLGLKWYCEQKVDVKDFHFFRDVGRGAFGVVAAARLEVTSGMTAIKKMNRRVIKGKKAVKDLLSERDVLQELGQKPSKFCIWLKYAFTDNEHMYFCLPLLIGGDLEFLLEISGGFFDLDRARFYAAEIYMGLSHLHSLGIVHRDLKPANVLLNDMGHCSISDMGLSRQLGDNGDEKLTGRAGTPGYWAPECLNGKPYSYGADWWSYGVCLFEFLTGKCPFSTSYSKCKSREDATLTYDIEFPVLLPDGKQTFPKSAKKMIEQLLNRKYKKRLGSKKGSYAKIANKAFFKSIDWDKIRNCEVEPPWKPESGMINAKSAKELEETDYFDKWLGTEISPDDEVAVDFSFTSQYAHQKDTVRILKHIHGQQKSSSGSTANPETSKIAEKTKKAASSSGGGGETVADSHANEKDAGSNAPAPKSSGCIIA